MVMSEKIGKQTALKLICTTYSRFSGPVKKLRNRVPASNAMERDIRIDNRNGSPVDRGATIYYKYIHNNYNLESSYYIRKKKT
jgi:hypothetical protein